MIYFPTLNLPSFPSSGLQNAILPLYLFFPRRQNFLVEIGNSREIHECFLFRLLEASPPPHKPLLPLLHGQYWLVKSPLLTPVYAVFVGFCVSFLAIQDCLNALRKILKAELINDCTNKKNLLFYQLDKHKCLVFIKKK